MTCGAVRTRHHPNTKGLYPGGSKGIYTRREKATAHSRDQAIAGFACREGEDTTINNLYCQKCGMVTEMQAEKKNPRLLRIVTILWGRGSFPTDESVVNFPASRRSWALQRTVLPG